MIRCRSYSDGCLSLQYNSGHDIGNDSRRRHFVGHGIGADGVAAINFIELVYKIMSGIALMIGSGCSVVTSIYLS
ncbi:MAG: hypothetical protein ACI4A8_05250 [Muribaculaceae bacterium]